ncbi:MAG: hypothetical protein LBF22_15190 [Deltaproteobacteria bacterium]|nr:hypothetical protein [Deltaproteobacteria bacterium]
MGKCFGTKFAGKGLKKSRLQALSPPWRIPERGNARGKMGLGALQVSGSLCIIFEGLLVNFL